MFNYKNLTPFQLFCCNNFPFIEETFDSLTTYKMLCKIVGYLQDKIIPAVDDIGNSQNEIIQSFNELKSYVDNYFTNLDVQEEIDKKLDEMSQDGTLENLINEVLFNELNEKVNNNTENINQLNENVNNINENVNNINENLSVLNDTKINLLRKKQYSNYHNFNFPVSMPDFFKILQIYESYDKKNYKYNLNKNLLKLSGGNTYYVDSNTGNDSNSGTSENQAWKTITKAINTTVSENSTIIIKKGIYFRDSIPNGVVLNKLKFSLNIICEENTLMGMFDNLTFSVNSQYNNVYQASRTNVHNCLDIRGFNNGVISELTKVSSLSDCASTLNSWYTDNTNVYVNIGETVDSTKVIFPLKIGFPGIDINSTYDTGKDLTLYLENAICINGTAPLIRVTSSSTKQATFYGVNCKFLYKEQTNNVYNGIEFLGSNSVLIDCESSFNGKDGFNYHMANTKSCNAIEINCKASYNGLLSGDNYANGSSIHDGGKIVRINGNYFNNKGSNVSDVNENTISFNFNCNAFDSLSDVNNFTKSDFSAQQSGTIMYLYNCFAKGSSLYNLYCIEGSTIYSSNSVYNTKEGNIVNI